MSQVILGLAALAMVLAAGPLARWLPARGGSMRVSLVITLGMALLGGILAGLFWQLDLNIEQHAFWMWLWVCVSAAAIGIASAAMTRRVPTIELVLATGAILEGCGLWLVVLGDDPGLSDAPVRALLVAPAAIGLFAYFGASLGYLLWGDQGYADSASAHDDVVGRQSLLSKASSLLSGVTATSVMGAALGYEAMVGRRFLLSKASSVLSTVTTISVVGVALGVWLVIVALAVLAGFEFDLQNKIIGANAHITLQRNQGRTFALPDGILERVDAVDGVVASSVFLQGEVALASRSNFTGGLLFGVDPVRSPRVLSVLGERLRIGSMDPLVDELKPPAPTTRPVGDIPLPAPVPNLVIGIEMKKTLNVSENDRVTVLSPLLERLTPVGAVPASRPFQTAAVFSSEMYEFDARFAFATIQAARRFFQVGSEHVSGIQIRVADPAHADRVGASVAAALGGEPCPDGERDRFDCGWEAIDWKGRNQTLFAALKLERVVAFVVLVFIILVASFSIVNTLTMSVIEKRKEIAILKTMGARDVGIMKLFLVQGMVVGGFGTLVGGGLALVTVALLETFGFWIPGAVYYIDSLPVHLEASDVILVVLAALLIVWDFAVFPALRGSQLEPVEGLRDG